MTKDEVLSKLAAKVIDVATASKLLAQLEKPGATSTGTGDVEAPIADTKRTSLGEPESRNNASDGGPSRDYSSCLVVLIVAIGLLWLLYSAATSPRAKHDPYVDNPLSDPDLYGDNPWHR